MVFELIKNSCYNIHKLPNFCMLKHRSPSVIVCDPFVSLLAKHNIEKESDHIMLKQQILYLLNINYSWQLYEV